MARRASRRWIIAVGDEVLSGHTAESNSHFLADRLRTTPYPVSRIVVLRGRVPAIVAERSLAAAGDAARAFCRRGQDPAPDDRADEVKAESFGGPLVGGLATVERIRSRTADLYRQGRLESPHSNQGNRKTDLVPEGSLVPCNPVGSALPRRLACRAMGASRWLTCSRGSRRSCGP